MQDVTGSNPAQGSSVFYLKFTDCVECMHLLTLAFMYLKGPIECWAYTLVWLVVHWNGGMWVPAEWCDENLRSSLTDLLCVPTAVGWAWSAYSGYWLQIWYDCSQMSGDVCIFVCTYMLMRDTDGRKKEARSYKQQSKATQHTHGSHFSCKNELLRVGLEPRTLYTLDWALYQLSLVVCITLLASFFLPTASLIKHVCAYIVINESKCSLHKTSALKFTLVIRMLWPPQESIRCIRLTGVRLARWAVVYLHLIIGAHSDILHGHLGKDRVG